MIPCNGSKWFLCFCFLYLPQRKYISRNKKNHHLHCVLPRIVRLELLRNAIENKVYYDLAATYYFQKKERKRTDRPEVIGVAKDRRRQGTYPN